MKEMTVRWGISDKVFSCDERAHSVLWVWKSVQLWDYTWCESLPNWHANLVQWTTNTDIYVIGDTPNEAMHALWDEVVRRQRMYTDVLSQACGDLVDEVELQGMRV